MGAERQPDVSVDMLAQLRGVVDRLNGIAAHVPGVAQATTHLPDFPTIPTPGKITATQISALVGAVQAQRSTMQALRSSLEAFDQQLEVLEQLIEPLKSVSDTWARIEGGVSGAREMSASDVATTRNSGA